MTTIKPILYESTEEGNNNSRNKPTYGIGDYVLNHRNYLPQLGVMQLLSIILRHNCINCHLISRGLTTDNC